MRHGKSGPPMSALGQKLPRPFQFSVSAFPPKAAAKVAERRVRYVPKADSCTAAKSIVIQSIHRLGRATAVGWSDQALLQSLG